MSIAQEMLLKIKKVMRLCRSRGDDDMLTSINNIWEEFIFRDMKMASNLKDRGYEFILTGQDIYDKGIDMGLPTGHYNYLLIITRNGRLVNPLIDDDGLKKALYKELLHDYIYIADCPAIYASVNKDNTSAGIFICSCTDEISASLKFSSILGDSLVYMHTGVPYLRFLSSKAIRVYKFRTEIPSILSLKNTIKITFNSHINGINAERIDCYFTI